MVACSSGAPNAPSGTSTGTPSAAGSVGTVSLALNLGAVSLTSLTYTISNPTISGFTTLSGSVDLSNSQAIGLTVTLPAGDGYSLTLQGTDSSGDPCAGGPTTFSVMGGQSTTVGLTLVCTQMGEAGLIGPDVNPGTVVIGADASFVVTGGGNVPCAAVKSLVAAPNNVDVGHSIPLTAVGIDPSYQTSDVTLAWSATGPGSLASTSGTSNSFACTAPGVAMVTVTASIANGGASCPSTGSVTVSLTCTGGGDAGSAVDAGADVGADASTADGSATEASTVDAGPESGTVEDSGPDAGPDASSGMEAGTDSSPGVDAAPDSGSTASTVPCTTAGQTNCVQCDQNAAPFLCTQTEAIIVQRDIEKGLVTGNVPTPSGGNADGSCYECLVSNFVIDGSGQGSGSECDDLTTGVQVCLDTLNCIMGSPQSGTAGAGGTKGTLQSACADAPSTSPSGQPVDGVFNCFCGTAQPNATACKAAPSISSGAAGIPNGTCRDISLAGTSDNAMSSNSTIVNDLSGISTPAGKAYKILTGAGTNGTPSSAACSQCYK